MKLKVLISILFIIATTFTAIHELEHINGKHNSSSCQICIVDDHSVSGDIVEVVKDVDLCKFEKITYNHLVYSFHAKNHTNQNRAPPFIS